MLSTVTGPLKMGPMKEPFPLNNTYEWTELRLNAFPLFHISGEQYDHSDLFQLIGKARHVTTFNFKSGSPAFIEYGESVTGEILYTKQEREALEALEVIATDRVKVIPYMAEFDSSKLKALKYEQGFDLKDLDHFIFVPGDKTPSTNEDGIKEIPNVIRIPVKNDPLLDSDRLWQGILCRKNNSGKELLKFEKEHLIGITLALNNRNIDPGIVGHLGYTTETLNRSKEIWNHFFKTKERRKLPFTEDEKTKFERLKIVLAEEKSKKFRAEIIRSRYKNSNTPEEKNLLREMETAIQDFEPGILLPGNREIYWDLDTYIHIVTRHVKQFQLGDYKSKSHFPYAFKELKLLIEKVLGVVDEEIEIHFTKTPNFRFKLTGSRGVFFNGDYFSVYIEPDGRLANIYPLGPGKGMSQRES